MASALDSVDLSSVASLDYSAASCVGWRASSGRFDETDSADGLTTSASAAASLGAEAAVVD